MFLKDSVLLWTVFLCGVCEYVTTFSYQSFCKYFVIAPSHHCSLLDQVDKKAIMDTWPNTLPYNVDFNK